MYLSIYNNLCNSRKSLVECYTSGSGLHKHHIIPKHCGGNDEDLNFTYLTVREHVIAHFLLWKLYSRPNDLRAMHMLGANLTIAQRKITGEYCRDNSIGFHGASDEDKYQWRKLGIKTQYDSKIGIHDPTMKSTYCSMGGKIGGKVQHEKQLGFHSPEVRKIATSLGGKSHTGKIWIYHPNLKKNTRIYPNDISQYTDNGWELGFKKSSS